MMRRLLCATAFLTRFPVPARYAFDGADVGRATMCFPLVGGLLGVLAVGVRHALAPVLPSSVVAFAIVAVIALATGALHLDGLADMADGFGGGRTREDVLRIMRDHVIGAYGACALVLGVGLTVSALAELVARGSDLVLVVVPMISRWPGVVVGRVVPYARREGGMGSAVTDHAGAPEVLGATLTAVAAAALCGWLGAALLVCTIVASALQARWCVRRIGGITGDTLGANVIVCEALMYVLAVALR